MPYGPNLELPTATDKDWQMLFEVCTGRRPDICVQTADEKFGQALLDCARHYGKYDCKFYSVYGVYFMQFKRHTASDTRDKFKRRHFQK